MRRFAGLMLVLAAACNPDPQSCTTDAQCAAGEVCDPQNHWCVRKAEPTPMTGCSTQKDCTVAGEFCNVITRKCEEDTVCNGENWCRKDALKADGTPQETLNGVFGLAPDNVLAVGAGALVVGFDGKTWKPQTVNGSTRRLQSVWAASGAAADRWAVGDGVILRYNGAAWAPETAAKADVVINDYYLFKVWGTDASNVWAAGGSRISGRAILLRRGAAGWEHAVPPSTVPGYLHGVWTANGSTVYAVGEPDANGPILILRGAAAPEFVGQKGDFLRDVTGSADGHVYAVGEEGISYHYDTRQWIRAQTGDKAPLYGVAAGPSGIWAVGSFLGMLKYEGETWKLATGVPYNKEKGANLDALFGVWVGQGVAWTVGFKGTAFRWLPK